MKINKNIRWSDLKFIHHHAISENEYGVKCYVKFKNGEWCSIIGAEKSFYGDGIFTFEICSSSTKKTKGIIKCWLSKKQVLRHLNYLNNK